MAERRCKVCPQHHPDRPSPTLQQHPMHTHTHTHTPHVLCTGVIKNPHHTCLPSNFPQPPSLCLHDPVGQTNNVGSHCYSSMRSSSNQAPSVASFWVIGEVQKAQPTSFGNHMSMKVRETSAAQLRIPWSSKEVLASPTIVVSIKFEGRKARHLHSKCHIC